MFLKPAFYFLLAVNSSLPLGRQTLAAAPELFQVKSEPVPVAPASEAVLAARSLPQWAAVFAPTLGTDLDVQARGYLEFTETCLAKGDLAVASELAALIPGYRQGVAWARIARLAVLKEDTALAAEALAKADMIAVAPHPWNLDAIRAAKVSALAAGGKLEAAEELVKTVSDDEQKLVAHCGLAVEKYRATSVAAMPEPPAKQKMERFGPEFLHIARAWLELGKIAQARGEKEQAGEFLLKARETVRQSRVEGVDLLLEISQRLEGLGSLEPAAATLGIAELYFNALGPTAQWKADYYRKFGNLYRERGLGEKAEALLAEAERFVGSLPQMWRPRGFVQVAVLAGQMAKKEKSVELWRQARDTALANPNPRIRALTGLEICRVQYEIGASPSAPVFDLLREIEASLKNSH